ncbi:Single-stranded-DNA-specific exonuclease RecJ [bacterium HR15]|nr:Single-stranded-DNA-specific exonuclease RecJ [bacterium HR15]
MARYRWRVRRADPQRAARLQKELNLSQQMAQLLVARGYEDPAEAYRFLHPSLSDLGDPMLLPDCERAVQRLQQAVQRKEPVLVYGDYDADGVTATALWLFTLRRLGVPAHPMLPRRQHEGYDLHPNAIDAAHQVGATLVLTCDCGVRAHKAVDALNAAGLEVVITDHHQPDSTLPNALAVVNPHRSDSRYPFADLSGVGVSFRVAEALVRTLRCSVDEFRQSVLDLVAVGTVADVMPLLGENRVLVAHGLQRLQNTARVGLRQLIEVAGLSSRPLTARDIGFMLGPRLNAAGRMEDAHLALQLLVEEDAEKARTLAKQLDQHNRERQKLQQAILDEALAQIEQEALLQHRALFVRSLGWHHGIIGLVAGKLMNLFYRPTFVVSLEEETGLARGSIRSIPAFDLTRVLAQIKPLCQKCGGHPTAGGFVVALEHLDELRNLILRIAQQELTDQDLIPELRIDLEVKGYEVNGRLMSELKLLEPFGEGNEAPLFLCRAVHVIGSRTSRDGRHLFLKIRPEGSTVLDAVLWEGGDNLLEPDTRLDLVFQPEEDTYYGYSTLRWRLHDYEERLDSCLQ